MPKEQINTPSRRVVTDFGADGFGFHYLTNDAELPANEHGDTHMEYSPVVFVSWSGEKNMPGLPDQGYVQIQVEIAEEEILRMADEIRRERAESEKNRKESWNPSDHVWWSLRKKFVTTALTRPELNKFIKTIQKARNAAFEADA